MKIITSLSDGPVTRVFETYEVIDVQNLAYDFADSYRSASAHCRRQHLLNYNRIVMQMYDEKSAPIFNTVLPLQTPEECEVWRDGANPESVNNWLHEALMMVCGKDVHRMELAFSDPDRILEKSLKVCVASDGRPVIRDIMSNIVLRGEPGENLEPKWYPLVLKTQEDWVRKARNSYLHKAIRDKDAQLAARRSAEVEGEFPFVSVWLNEAYFMKNGKP